MSAATAREGRRRTLAVDVAAALGTVGRLVKYLGLAFIFPSALALGYGEPVWPFLAAGAATAVFGLLLELVPGGERHVGAREGFLIIALLWLVAAASSGLPYVFSGVDQLSSPVDAYFEGMSGFTTTGASVVSDLESLPRSIVMWRQFTVWLGGIGIIVLALAVLPRLRVGGRQLFEAEITGPDTESLTATIRATARRFVRLYFALTVLMFLVLGFLGWSGIDERMNSFEAAAHTFATMGTGGFSTQTRSMEVFAPVTQWIVVVFLVAAGTNYALMFHGLVRRRVRVFARDEEFRLYILIMLAAAALLFAELWAEGIARGEEAVRFAVFQSVSTTTTAGFANADYNNWTVLTSVTVVALMFCGACAGSTTGSIKVVRHLLVGRILRRELDLTVHPDLVSSIRMNGVVVEDRTLRAVYVFVLLYIGFFAAGALALLLDAARTDLGLSAFEGIASSATMLGNNGPSFGFAGPMGSFEPFSDVSKLLMIGLMWIGRLEIVPIVLLFTRSYWRP